MDEPVFLFPPSTLPPFIPLSSLVATEDPLRLQEMIHSPVDPGVPGVKVIQPVFDHLVGLLVMPALLVDCDFRLL